VRIPYELRPGAGVIPLGVGERVADTVEVRDTDDDLVGEFELVALDERVAVCDMVMLDVGVCDGEFPSPTWSEQVAEMFTVPLVVIPT
jgi:hypothetical protein